MKPSAFISPLKEVSNFLAELKQILTSDQYELDILLRKKDEDPLDPFTTENTMSDLDYDSEDVRNELLSLTERDYIETILDDKDSSRPPFSVFGKLVKNKDIYIKLKIRSKSKNKVFCVSFHYPGIL